MGYGEFGGGGSVGWQVIHGSGNLIDKAKDPDPALGSGGRFVVFVNGVKVADVGVDEGHIVILWGRHVTDPNAPNPPETRNVPLDVRNYPTKD